MGAGYPMFNFRAEFFQSDFQLRYSIRIWIILGNRNDNRQLLYHNSND